jgi:hypothetical protein
MLATAHLQQRDPVALLVSLLRAPGPVLADLAIPAPRAWLASGGGADPGGAVDLAAGVQLLAKASRSGARTAALPVGMALPTSARSRTPLFDFSWKVLLP